MNGPRLVHRFQKAISHEEIESGLRVPTDKRIFILTTTMKQNFTIDQVYELTAIDPWFLNKMKNIVDLKARATRV